MRVWRRLNINQLQPLGDNKQLEKQLLIDEVIKMP